MIKVRGKIAVPKFNKKYFNAALQKALKEGQKEAIRRWVTAVVKATPVYTGTAQATLMPVGRAVNYYFSITPSPNAKWKKAFKYNGLEYPLGVSYGRRYQEYVIKQTFAPNAYTYTFEFDMDLLYSVWNNKQRAPAWLHLLHPTPWRGTEYGARNFQRYVMEVLPKTLPMVKLAFTWTQIRVK